MAKTIALFIACLFPVWPTNILGLRLKISAELSNWRLIKSRVLFPKCFILTIIYGLTEL